MAFELFKSQAKSYMRKVSINPAGQIGINSGAVIAFSLHQYHFVRFLFDRELSSIGLNLVQRELDGAVRLRKSTGGFGISARNFLNYYNILPKMTTIFPVKAVDNTPYGKLLIIRIRDGVVRGQKSAPALENSAAESVEKTTSHPKQSTSQVAADPLGAAIAAEILGTRSPSDADQAIEELARDADSEDLEVKF